MFPLEIIEGTSCLVNLLGFCGVTFDSNLSF